MALGLDVTTPRVHTLDDIRDALIPVLRRGRAFKAIAFGSFARGDSDEFSDLDLMIVAGSRRVFLERFKDFLDMWSDSPVKPLDVLVYSPAEFERMRRRENPFIMAAITEGLLIYEAQPETRGYRIHTAGLV